MTVREFLNLEIDIDVFDDYAEELEIAFVGPVDLTDLGEEKFFDIMKNEILIDEETDTATIHIENEREHKLAKLLFYGAAGYISFSKYKTLFATEL